MGDVSATSRSASTHSQQLCQISDVWRQEAELLRSFDDEVDVGDVYDGLRLRTSDDGVDLGDRSDLLRIRIIHS